MKFKEAKENSFLSFSIEEHFSYSSVSKRNYCKNIVSELKLLAISTAINVTFTMEKAENLKKRKCCGIKAKILSAMKLHNRDQVFFPFPATSKSQKKKKIQL